MKTIEQEFTKEVIRFAEQNGWKLAHFRPGMMANGRWITAGLGDVKGFPDLVLVKGKRLLFVELKTLTGEMKDEQIDWMVALWQTTAECFLWTPSYPWKEVLQ